MRGQLNFNSISYPHPIARTPMEFGTLSPYRRTLSPCLRCGIFGSSDPESCRRNQIDTKGDVQSGHLRAVFLRTVRAVSPDTPKSTTIPREGLLCHWSQISRSLEKYCKNYSRKNTSGPLRDIFRPPEAYLPPNVRHGDARSILSKSPRHTKTA